MRSGARSESTATAADRHHGEGELQPRREFGRAGGHLGRSPGGSRRRRWQRAGCRRAHPPGPGPEMTRRRASTLSTVKAVKRTGAAAPTRATICRVNVIAAVRSCRPREAVRSPIIFQKSWAVRSAASRRAAHDCRRARRVKSRFAALISHLCREISKSLGRNLGGGETARRPEGFGGANDRHPRRRHPRPIAVGGRLGPRTMGQWSDPAPIIRRARDRVPPAWVAIVETARCARQSGRPAPERRVGKRAASGRRHAEFENASLPACIGPACGSRP